MTRIDFYTEAADKLDVACRIAHKAYRARRPVVLFSSDDALLARIDKMLWTSPAIGFLPHCFAADAIAAETPVLLTRAVDTPHHDDVLINLDDSWPPSFARFQRLAEIVTVEEDDRVKARARYRFYKDRGYEVITHRMTEAVNG
jgi:DNA polymerase III subunit chi